MKNQFTKILCGFFALLSYNLIGQIPKSPVNIQTPNATSFNTLADYKVSSFVGSPDISVPICKLSDGAIDIPIALNYSARGVRPDVHPGWVGLNMNLSIGGESFERLKMDQMTTLLGLIHKAFFIQTQK